VRTDPAQFEFKYRGRRAIDPELSNPPTRVT
jgi:hypothetical protein